MPRIGGVVVGPVITDYSRCFLSRVISRLISGTLILEMNSLLTFPFSLDNSVMYFYFQMIIHATGELNKHNTNVVYMVLKHTG